ncbi:MAG: hypothetical protein ACRD2R_07165, partial [Terriglobales bacterium]
GLPVVSEAKPPLLQLTGRETVFTGGNQDLEALRARFSSQHVIRLPGFCSPGLLSTIQQQLESAEFRELKHEGIGAELCMAENLTAHVLRLVMNDRRLHEIVEFVTCCGPIGCFEGRVYRVVPGASHHDSWHDDLADTRRKIGLSLNLSRAEFSGSAFELCEWSTGRVLARVANTGIGDAILFRLAPFLKHRISPLEGNVPKTAYAGWFQDQPEFHELLQEQFSAVKDKEKTDSAGRAPERLDRVPGRSMHRQRHQTFAKSGSGRGV